MFTELCIGYQTITDSIQVLSHIHFRILLVYKCSTWYITSVAERSKALTFLSWTGVVWVRIPLGTHIFILNVSLPANSEQFIGAHVNEIKHDHSPVVIGVLDSRYDLSYKALYIHTCSKALTCKLLLVGAVCFFFKCIHVHLSRSLFMNVPTICWYTMQSNCTYFPRGK